ncbi:MAG: hypothetical protein AAGA87_00590 [Pseudomonadota bacterium]
MINRIALVVTLLAVLASCGRIAESRLNPFNWFGRDRAVAAAELAVVAEDPRPLVSQVTSVTIEQTPGGAILRAVGLPPRQGFWEPALLGPDRQGDILVFQLRAEMPPTATRVSTQPSRELVVGAFISEQTLAGVREIQVLGAQASRAISR